MTSFAIKQRKVGLLATAATFAMIAAPALSQTTVAATTADTAAAGDEEIVVTGSLIKNPNLERSAPVTVTSSDEIELKQSNVAEEVLREIPGIVPSIGSAVNNGNGGASFVNLRGLGSIRNIVLLDGNRIAPSGLAGRVDLNNIPLALLNRVEVLTGGASTTYGADAISGVVNFITKQDFSGVDISASEQITEKGDGNTFRTDLTIGGNFDDGKGNVVVSLGYQEADPVYQGARDYGAFNISSFGGTFGGSGTAIPSRFSGTRGLTGGAPNMAPESIFTGRGAPTATQPLGAPIYTPNPLGATNGAVRQVDPTTGQALAPFAAFNFNPYNIYQTPFKRFNIFAQAKYEFTDNIEVYNRALFSKNTVNTIVAPSGAFGPAVSIPLSNPYLPAALRNQFCAFDVNPRPDVYTPRFTPAECAAAATATATSDPAYRVIGGGGFVPFDVDNNGTIAPGEGYNPNPQVTLARRTTEVGPRVSQFTTTIFDYRAGLRGKLTDSLDWDIGGSYGESENRQALQGYVLTSRVRDTLLATNTTTCLSGNAGCVPVNFFGPEGSITAAQIPYITGESTTLVKTTLAQGRGTISDDFGVAAPWAQDPIGIAVGTEYRKYTASQRSDSLSQTPGELGGAGGAAPNITGGYDVWEAFGELVAPLVQDAPFFKSLTLEAGVRYSSYKVDAPSSPSYKTTTYKAGGSWEPIDGLKLRGNYSHAVRAPNIGELFSPVSTVLTTLTNDPCASLTAGGAAPIAGRPAQPATLRAVCLAQGATAGNVNSIAQPTANQANVTTGGNVNVKPEKSNSYTFGAVIQPAMIPGFSLTVDYYNIKVKGAITTPSSGDAITACFGTPTGINYTPSASAATDPACTAIRRNPLTGGLDGSPDITPGLFTALSNLGSLKTDGIDVSANYSRDIGFAKLGLTFTGNYTHDSKFNANTTVPTSVNRECTGYYSAQCASIQPKFQWSQRTTLSFKQIDVSLLWRHIDSVEQEPLDITLGNGPAFVGTLNGGSGAAAAAAAGNPNIGRAVDFQHIKAFNYFDLSTRVGVNDNLSMTVTVENLLDKKPPLVGTGVGTTAFNSGNTFPSTYDTLGRRFAVQARLKF